MELEALSQGITGDPLLDVGIADMIARKSQTMELEPEPANTELLGIIRNRVQCLESAAKALPSGQAADIAEVNRVFRSALRQYWE